MNLTTDNTAIVLDSTSDYPEAPARFPNMRFVPLYVRFGDWVEWACLLAVAGAVVVAVSRRRLGTPDPEPRGSDQ